MNEKEDQLILNYNFFINFYHMTSVKWGSEIMPCNKINKPLVVYRFSGNVMTSTTTLRNDDVFTPEMKFQSNHNVI